MEKHLYVWILSIYGHCVFISVAIPFKINQNIVLDVLLLLLVKLTIYCSVYIPAFIYGQEQLAVTKNIWLQLQAAQTSILQRVSGLTLQSQGIGPVTWLPPVWCLCRTSFVLVLFCLFFSSAYISRELNIVSFYMTCWKRWTEAVLMDISLLRLFKPVQYKKTQGQIQALLDKLSLSCLGIQHVVMYCYWDSSNCGQNLISVHDYSDADLS